MSEINNNPNPEMPRLPAGFVPYSKTKLFTQDTVPKGFLRDHTTKAGTWGLLTIESGSLQYVITEPGYEAEHLLTPKCPGVIVTQQRHHIHPTEPVKFTLEFYHQPV